MDNDQTADGLVADAGTDDPGSQKLNEKFTVEQVAQALRASAGINYAAAQILKCSRQTIANYLDRYPKLQQVKADAKEGALDIAESKLLIGINEGDMRAVTYFLDRQGEERGYGRRTQISTPKGAPLPVDVQLNGYTEEQLRKIQQIHRAAQNGSAGPSTGAS